MGGMTSIPWHRASSQRPCPFWFAADAVKQDPCEGLATGDGGDDLLTGALLVGPRLFPVGDPHHGLIVCDLPPIAKGNKPLIGSPVLLA